MAIRKFHWMAILTSQSYFPLYLSKRTSKNSSITLLNVWITSSFAWVLSMRIRFISYSVVCMYSSINVDITMIAFPLIPKSSRVELSSHILHDSEAGCLNCRIPAVRNRATGCRHISKALILSSIALRSEKRTMPIISSKALAYHFFTFRSMVLDSDSKGFMVSFSITDTIRSRLCCISECVDCVSSVDSLICVFLFSEYAINWSDNHAAVAWMLLK